MELVHLPLKILKLDLRQDRKDRLIVCNVEPADLLLKFMDKLCDLREKTVWCIAAIFIRVLQISYGFPNR